MRVIENENRFRRALLYITAIANRTNDETNTCGCPPIKENDAVRLRISNHRVSVRPPRFQKLLRRLSFKTFANFNANLIDQR